MSRSKPGKCSKRLTTQISLLRKAVQKMTAISKQHARKYINSISGLLKKWISKRNAQYASAYRQSEFRSTRGLSKLWSIRDHPLKAVLRQIKRIWIRRKEKFMIFSMKQIIEILEKREDHLACFYFLNKYSRKLLLSNAFIACNNKTLETLFFDFGVWVI